MRPQGPCSLLLLNQSEACRCPYVCTVHNLWPLGIIGLSSEDPVYTSSPSTPLLPRMTLPSAAKCCQVLNAACTHCCQGEGYKQGRNFFIIASLPHYYKSSSLVVVDLVVGVLVVVLVVEGMVLGPLLNPGDVLLVFPIPVLQLVLWYRQNYPLIPSSAAARE